MSSRIKSKPAKDASSLFILHYKTRRVLVKQPLNYDLLQQSIWRHFPELPAGHTVSYHTDELPICKGYLVEISEDSWEDVIPMLDSLVVQCTVTTGAASTSSKGKERCREENENGDAPSSSTSSRAEEPPAKKRRTDAFTTQSKPGGSRMSLYWVTMSGEEISLPCSRASSIRDLLREALRALKRDPETGYRAIWEGSRVADTDGLFWDDKTVSSLGISDGDTIEIMEILKGGKPVIYLLPPSNTTTIGFDASVRLELVPEWSFSAVYPVVDVASSRSGEGRQVVQWDVTAARDGTLLEKTTGLEVAYLFWEAEALARGHHHQDDAANVNEEEGGSGVERFIPDRPHLDPSNSVVVSVADITPYLDAALKALGLHVEARTSFITYWLPSLLKYTHIALRFLPQHAYERAAPLAVTPKPDVVLRVFMLFRGISKDELERDSGSAPGAGWARAWKKFGDPGRSSNAKFGDVEKWRDVVGLDESRRADDETLFRVVEWGGMEVLG